jgi:hypothetical protein
MDALTKAGGDQPAARIVPGSSPSLRRHAEKRRPNSPGPATIRVEASHISASSAASATPAASTRRSSSRDAGKPGDHGPGGGWTSPLRRTGLFAKALRDLAADDFERAYARAG